MDCSKTDCDVYDYCSKQVNYDRANKCGVFKPLKAQTEPVAAVPCSAGLEGQTRYKLEYAGHAVSFSATKAATREQLAEVLEEFIEMLRAPEDTGEIGFF